MSAIRNVLFLCTGNSARSVMAECLLARHGGGRFAAYSAGSHPNGKVNPHALALLEGQGFDVSSLRSKSWDEFEAPGAPLMDFVITVCDNAARESCPVWLGKATRVHWGLPDPSQGDAGDGPVAFTQVIGKIERRIRRLLGQPFETLDAGQLAALLETIGEQD